MPSHGFAVATAERIFAVTRHRFPKRVPQADVAPRVVTQRSGPKPSRDTIQVYGFHAVLAAITARRRKLISIRLTEAAAGRLSAEMKAAGLSPEIVTADDLTRRLGAQAVHQGVLLETGPIEPIDISEITTRSGIVLVLDQITDPHNVGAILRTAAAFDVDALVTTTRHAPDFSGIVAKAASGGVDHVPIVEVVNLARALEDLARMGYWRVGLDSDGPTRFEDAPVTRPVALVLGAEDKGLRRLTRENCDALARLDMPGAIKSLNVSNACAVALTLTRLRLRDHERPHPDAP